MKKKVLVAVMVLTMLLGLFGCSKKTQITVTSVEAMTLTLHGMRGSNVYKFEGDDDTTELRRYRVIYSSGEEALALEASVPCSTQTLIELMNACGIPRWDGFHGKHPKNVSDGIMFDFAAEINGGQTIHAGGSANYPKGYYEFVRALDEMLAKEKMNHQEA